MACIIGAEILRAHLTVRALDAYGIPGAWGELVDYSFDSVTQHIYGN